MLRATQSLVTAAFLLMAASAQAGPLQWFRAKLGERRQAFAGYTAAAPANYQMSFREFKKWQKGDVPRRLQASFEGDMAAYNNKVGHPWDQLDASLFQAYISAGARVPASMQPKQVYAARMVDLDAKVAQLKKLTEYTKDMPSTSSLTLSTLKYAGAWQGYVTDRNPRANSFMNVYTTFEGIAQLAKDARAYATLHGLPTAAVKQLAKTANLLIAEHGHDKVRIDNVSVAETRVVIGPISSFLLPDRDVIAFKQGLYSTKANEEALGRIGN